MNFSLSIGITLMNFSDLQPYENQKFASLTMSPIFMCLDLSSRLLCASSTRLLNSVSFLISIVGSMYVASYFCFCFCGLVFFGVSFYFGMVQVCLGESLGIGDCVVLLYLHILLLFFLVFSPLGYPFSQFPLFLYIGFLTLVSQIICLVYEYRFSFIVVVFMFCGVPLCSILTSIMFKGVLFGA